MPETNRVLIVDEDADFAQALARDLCQSGFAALQYKNATDLIEAYQLEGPTCLICDVMMPDMDCFQLVEEIRRRDKAVGIIFMTAWPTPEAAVDAIRLFGGLDYLSKPLNIPRLLASIKEALEWSARHIHSSAKLARLTGRESQVFELLVRGYRNKEIACQLSLSEKTIEDHRKAIMEKAEASSLADLIALNGAARNE